MEIVRILTLARILNRLRIIRNFSRTARFHFLCISTTAKFENRAQLRYHDFRDATMTCDCLILTQRLKWVRTKIRVPCILSIPTHLILTYRTALVPLATLQLPGPSYACPFLCTGVVVNSNSGGDLNEETIWYNLLRGDLHETTCIRRLFKGRLAVRFTFYAETFPRSGFSDLVKFFRNWLNFLWLEKFSPTLNFFTLFF